MIGNHLKVALRNLLKYRSHSIINIAGLAVGIGTAILILQFIRFEYSFDSFHGDADAIYRVSVVSQREGNVEYDSPVFVPPLGPAMKAEFPEVEQYTRISTPRPELLYLDGQPVKLAGLCYADSTLFDLFTFPLLAGDPHTALVEPHSLVLTASSARKIFGDTDPLGEFLTAGKGQSYTITGVMADPPPNSHLRFNALVSFATLYTDPGRYMGWNGGNQYIAYVKLREGVDPAQVEAKFPDFMWPHINQQLAEVHISYHPYLQPLLKIHLHHGDYTGASFATIFIFSTIAVLILLIASINFVNMTLARSHRRSLEVGVRKVLGAERFGLVRQFLTESLLICLIAAAFSFLLAELVGSFFQEMLGRDIPITGQLDAGIILMVLALVVVVGLLAGGYPAYYLATRQAAHALKPGRSTGPRKMKLRNVLVVVQFAISIALIICTLLINRQITFMRDKDLGFNPDNLLIIPLQGEEAQQKYDVLTSSLNQLSAVESVAASSQIPIRGFTQNGYTPEGLQSPLMIHVVDVDEQFLDTYGIDLLAGSNFSDELTRDDDAYLVNQSLARLLGWDDPLGRTIRRNGEHQVIGLVEDFHYATLYHTIEPLIFTNRPWHDEFNFLTLRLQPRGQKEAVAAVAAAWNEIVPGAPFEYWFLSESYQYLYLDEQRLRLTILFFSCVALTIALFGLYSLAAYSVETRTKEIGIRKVLGATVTGVMRLVSVEYLLLVGIANAVAWPVAWIVMRRWLENFAYRTEVSLWIFLFAGLLAFVIALLTVSLKSFRAAAANPVKSLRYE